MKSLRLLMILALVVCSSCFKHYVPDYKIPAPFVYTYSGPAAGEPAARVTVLRGSELAGSAIYFGLTLDSRVISSLLTAEHTEFDLSPGEHRIGVTCFAWFKWRGNELVIDVEAGSSRYFVLRGEGSGCVISELFSRGSELAKLQEGSLLVPVGTEGPP
jgi:hypothetical protein